jgi:xylulokinase
LDIPVEEIRASGGGSRNFAWREIQADIYGKELVILRESEGSAYGAAMLAGVGAKIYSSVEESARQAIQVRERMTPQTKHVEVYNRQYEVYRNLYPAVKNLAHQLAAISANK